MAIKVALCGNPNVGKTSLFNALTGLRQYVANWAGVTVEVKEGVRKWQGKQIEIVDLPGTYTLTSFSLDEKVAREYLLYKPVDVVVVIADALNLYQGLYLLLEVVEMGVKAILAVNAIDEARKKNVELDRYELSKHLGVSVVFTSAVTGEGIEDLLNTIVKVASLPAAQVRVNYSEDIEKTIDEVRQSLSQIELSGMLSRWFSLKCIENDPEIMEFVSNRGVKIDFSVFKGMGEKIARQKYDMINLVLKEAVKKREKSLNVSEAIDHVLTHKYLGIPIFLALMYLAFNFAFSTVQPLTDAVEWLFTAAANLIKSTISSEMISSLLADGVLSGVGGVLSFVPNIFALFLILGVMEESGYLPRAAFVVDRIMYSLKLSGRSFMSFLLGFGCSVPAVMSTRGISDPKERLVTILSVPFISCSARLPVYLLLASIFFRDNAGTVVFGMYALSILVSISTAVFTNKILFKGEPSFLIMELPRYRFPTAKNIVLYLWNRGKHFLIKAGTIIFAASIIIWILSYFPAQGDVSHSFAAYIGKAVSVIMKPFGFDWRISTALVFGVAAKEVIVSALSMFFGFSETISFAQDLSMQISPLQAFALLVFVMAYVPCFATLGAIYSETGQKRWVVFTVFYSLLVAYLLALAVVFIGGLVL